MRGNGVTLQQSRGCNSIKKLTWTAADAVPALGREQGRRQTI
jgi:hypothetical protein